MISADTSAEGWRRSVAWFEVAGNISLIMVLPNPIIIKRNGWHSGEEISSTVALSYSTRRLLFSLQVYAENQGSSDTWYSMISSRDTLKRFRVLLVFGTVRLEI